MKEDTSEGHERWFETPLDTRVMDPEDRARAALHQIMPPTYGELLRRVTKAIGGAEESMARPRPADATCPLCGEEALVEFWSGLTVCESCGHLIVPQSTDERESGEAPAMGFN